MEYIPLREIKIPRRDYGELWLLGTWLAIILVWTVAIIGIAFLH